MLQLTSEETAFAADLAAEAEQVNDAIRALQNLPRLHYSASDEDRAARQVVEDRVLALRTAYEEKAKGRLAIRVQLKNEFNEFIASKVPGGEAGALLDVANDVLVALTTDENTVGTAQLLKTVVVMGLDAFNDADIHAARARGIFARYTALVNTGLPEDFVRQIMIAEAARAIPMPSLSNSNKR